MYNLINSYMSNSISLAFATKIRHFGYAEDIRPVTG